MSLFLAFLILCCTFTEANVSILQETKLNRIAQPHLLFSRSISNTVMRATVLCRWRCLTFLLVHQHVAAAASPLINHIYIL